MKQKQKLIALLSVASLSVGVVAALASVFAFEDRAIISANDTRYFEVTAADIALAIGGGSDGTFTVDGIGFSVDHASVSAGVVTITSGDLYTTTTAGTTVNPETGMGGAGYVGVEFINMNNTEAGSIRTLDDGGALINAHTIEDGTDASYKVDFPSDSTPTRIVSNLKLVFGDSMSFSSVKFYYECAVPENRHNVRFLVDGEPILSLRVADGQYANAPANPSKEPDASAPKYTFKGWDKDPASTAITEDTDFNAQWNVYAFQDFVDDFEDYEVNSELSEAGWYATCYKNGGWTKDTTATVVLSANSDEGNQSLRLNSFKNGMDFKILKEFNEENPNTHTLFSNAVKFRLMTPVAPTAARVLLNFPVNYPGQGLVTATLKYDIPVTTAEYVDYVIPYDATGWKLWDNPVNIRETAAQLGIDCDSLASMLESIEIYLKYPSATPSNYAAFLDSFSFVTVDEDEVDIDEPISPYMCYTGTTQGGNVFKLQVTDAQLNAVASIIDLEDPIVVNGKVAINGKNATFTSNDSGATLTYNGLFTNRGKKITFTSATGAGASLIGEMDLFAVQTVDNYEQYSQDGQAYCVAHPNKDERYGARGAYYSEYYANNADYSSDWGGSKWSLLGGDGSQLKLKYDGGGHNGSTKYLCLKNGTVYMRYMQWGLFDGTSDKNAFRGSTFSFWLKTNGVVNQVKASFYSQSGPTNATKDTFVKTDTFINAAALTEWTHYEIAIDPNQVYYGFMIEIPARASGEAYAYIDDVEVYTANPYATYVAKTDVELPVGMTYTAKYSGAINQLLEIKAGNTATLSIPGFGMSVDGTFEADLDEVTFTFDSTEYVVTASDDLNQLSFVSVTGSDIYAERLNNASFKMIEYADNAESYESSGKMYYQGNTDESQASGARGAYHCDYYTGGHSNLSPIGGDGWTLMGGSGDQLSLDTSKHVDGSKSLKMKFSTAGNMRYLQWCLKTGAGKQHKNFNHFGLYINNPSSVDVPVKIYAYHSNPAVTPSTQGDQYRTVCATTIPHDGNWTFVDFALDSTKTYYGYGIYMNTKAATDYIYVDKAFYYNDYESPEMDFFAPSGLVLSGTTNAGDTTLTISAKGAATIVAPAASLSYDGKYSFYHDGSDQILKFAVNDSNYFTGTYIIDALGNITFSVVSAAGGFATAMTAGQTLTYSPS